MFRITQGWIYKRGGLRLFDHTDWKSKKRSTSPQMSCFPLKISLGSKKRSARPQMPYERNERAVCYPCLVLVVNFQKKKGSLLFVMRPLIFSGALGFSVPSLLVNPALELRHCAVKIFTSNYCTFKILTQIPFFFSSAQSLCSVATTQCALFRQ